MTAPRFHAERRISAAPDRVWALLVDLASWRAWNPTIVSIEGVAVPGGTVRLVSTVNPQRTFTVRVTELVPSRRMAWASGMPLGLFRGVRTYSLAPAAADVGTDFTVTEEYTGPLARMIGRSIPDLGPSFEIRGISGPLIPSHPSGTGAAASSMRRRMSARLDTCCRTHGTCPIPPT